VTTTYHYSYDSGETKYNYNGLLTGRSINGVRYSKFGYDEKSRATRTEHAGGVERYSFAYVEGEPGELTTTETNPLGKQAVYSFKKEKLQSITGKPSAHCAASFSDVKYDTNGYKDNAADFEGNLTDYTYDDHGHLLKKIEAYGEPSARTTEFGWDEITNRLTKVSVLGLRETVYKYLPNGRASSIEVKNLSANGVASQVRKTTYTYTLHTNGLIATMKIDGPLAGSSDVSTKTFSSAGDVISTENGLGHKTTFSNHNGYGQPGSVVGPNGDRADFVYDAIGRLLEERVHRAGVIRTTSYKYDGFGRLASVTYPDGVKHGYQYDVAGRLISEHVPEGGGLYAQKVYTYNAMSLPIAEEIRRISFEPAQGTVQ
jgi:YD repeat-containing protein